MNGLSRVLLPRVQEKHKAIALRFKDGLYPVPQ